MVQIWNSLVYNNTHYHNNQRQFQIQSSEDGTTCDLPQEAVLQHEEQQDQVDQDSWRQAGPAG